MSDFFQFEADFVESLRCIPMQVRYKLDTCGVKLKLTHWHQFSREIRQALVKMPCETKSDIQAYREFLRQVVREYSGDDAKDLPVEDTPPWTLPYTIPESVQQKSEEMGVDITPSEWAGLTPLQRFALIKLSKSGHENRNFVPALQEFRQIQSELLVKR